MITPAPVARMVATRVKPRMMSRTSFACLLGGLAAFSLACDKGGTEAETGKAAEAKAGDDAKSEPAAEAKADAPVKPADDAPMPEPLPKLFEPAGGGDKCDFIDAAAIAKALELDASKVSPIEGTCLFDITLADGATSSFNFSRATLAREQVAEQIAQCSDPSGLLEASKDASGIVDICRHKPQGYLMLRHRAHPNAIKITYGGMLTRKLTPEQKPARAAAAAKLADAIVAAHR